MDLLCFSLSRLREIERNLEKKVVERIALRDRMANLSKAIKANWQESVKKLIENMNQKVKGNYLLIIFFF